MARFKRPTKNRNGIVKDSTVVVYDLEGSEVFTNIYDDSKKPKEVSLHSDAFSELCEPEKSLVIADKTHLTRVGDVARGLYGLARTLPEIGDISDRRYIVFFYMDSVHNREYFNTFLLEGAELLGGMWDKCFESDVFPVEYFKYKEDHAANKPCCSYIGPITTAMLSTIAGYYLSSNATAFIHDVGEALAISGYPESERFYTIREKSDFQRAKFITDAFCGCLSPEDKKTINQVTKGCYVKKYLIGSSILHMFEKHLRNADIDVPDAILARRIKNVQFIWDVLLPIARMTPDDEELEDIPDDDTVERIAKYYGIDSAVQAVDKHGVPLGDIVFEEERINKGFERHDKRNKGRYRYSNVNEINSRR